MAVGCSVRWGERVCLAKESQERGGDGSAAHPAAEAPRPLPCTQAMPPDSSPAKAQRCFEGRGTNPVGNPPAQVALWAPCTHCAPGMGGTGIHFPTRLMSSPGSDAKVAY